MSLVFLKSADDKQDGRYNPNKPYRFSNYLTNPLTIPKNAQVAYVSSQFLVDGNGVPPDEPSWISTSEDVLGMLSSPVQLRWQNDETRKLGGWQSIMNSWSLSANEFGMDGDFSPTKYFEIPSESGVPQADFGFRSNYIPTDNKVQIESYIRFAIDQYNLYFNCLRTNPDYLTSSWSGTPGATIQPGLNFTDKVDDKFHDDCSIRAVNSPSGNTSFIGGNCFGYRVGVETNNGNARPLVYANGANYYNTGLAATGLDGNGGLYDFGGVQGAAAPPMPFNAGRYAMVSGTCGLKKTIGDITPSRDPQQSNTGGHQQIGHLRSGGYCIWTVSNIDQNVANAQYTAAISTKEGFCGWAPQFVGLHSIPYMSQRGRDVAIQNGVDPDIANDYNIQLQNFLKVVDLNNSVSADRPFDGDARFLIGLDILNEGSPPDVDLVARPKVLDTIEGSITKSRYRELGAKFVPPQNGLSLQALSKGINTACDPPYVFSADQYSINTYNTTAGRTPASLFFRFRWINKYQIDIEFTLSVQGFAGTYIEATDEPYAPAQPYSDPPDATNADPRDKWCLLGSMLLEEITGETDYIIPSYMGDLGFVHYPMASSPDEAHFRSLVKGYFDPKLTNRYFKGNNNGGGKQYAPFSGDNPYYAGIDTLGVLAYNASNPNDPNLTSQALINADYQGEPLLTFNPNGFLSTEIFWLGNPLQFPDATQSYRKTDGNPAWLKNYPQIELAYILGFANANDPGVPILIPVDATVTNGGKNLLLATNDIDATNEAFSNHIQISNLPIQSSNGVVSSICKTIYIVNSLCINDTLDNAEYRYYCDKAPYPLWIDLNNLEEIQVNKLDILITQDNNTEQKNLIGESQVVIMFRSKTEGSLPNTIPHQSISTTRTY